MTIEEAKEKYCPFCFSIPPSGENYYKCIAHLCMAWQWITPDEGLCKLIDRHLLKEN